jgi:D-alanyl-D-alanine carboxypeptidase/D-alanyl-D-alanine-endopeptidase (penicillin-binding protein 4)
MEQSATQSIPFITHGVSTGLELLKDSLGKSIQVADESIQGKIKGLPHRDIFSQPTDSLLKKMMYRSDNFYADMSLIMVAREKFGSMDEKRIIQYLLDNDLKDLPQKPRWVDGSGLSRYNQFSPEDMIAVLTKMKAELLWERIQTIFPKNSDGIEWLNKNWGENAVIAKSGSMSGVLCLSGYIKSKTNNWLTFSIMINNHQSSGTLLRKKIETFLGSLNL